MSRVINRVHRKLLILASWTEAANAGHRPDRSETRCYMMLPAETELTDVLWTPAAGCRGCAVRSSGRPAEFHTSTRQFHWCAYSSNFAPLPIRSDHAHA